MRDGPLHRRPTVTRRRAVPALLVVVAVVAGALAACGDDDGDTVDSTATTAARDTTTSSTADTVPAETVAVTVYFAQDELLHAIAADVEVEEGAVLRATLERLLAGPTGPGSEAGDTTEIPEGTELLDLAVTDGTATVDLSSGFTSGGGSESMLMRVAQVTYTATQFPTVGQVRYRIDGDDVTVIGGESVLVDPSRRVDFEAVLPQVFVDAPPDGAEVGEAFEVSGTSNTFEATHQIELVDSTGSVFLADHVTASSGNGTRGEWTYPARIPVGVSGGITLRVYVISPMDGRETDEVEVALAVAAG